MSSNCAFRGKWREGSNRYKPWILPADGQLSEWYGGMGQSHTQSHMGSTWRGWGSQEWIHYFGFAKRNFTPLEYKFWAINDWILLFLCAVWLQGSLGSTSRKQCCMKPSLAISDWSLCLLNNACVSYESTGSKRRAFSEPPGRKTMSGSCRMRLTVARSQFLTGDALGGEFLSLQVARLKTVLRGILHVFSLTVPQMSTQWHRCWSCIYGSCRSP